MWSQNRLESWHFFGTYFVQDLRPWERVACRQSWRATCSTGSRTWWWDIVWHVWLALQVLGQEGVSPKLLATFANGIVCEFVTGQVLTKELVLNHKIGIKVASAMARLHSTKRTLPQIRRESVLWPRLYAYINLLPEEFILENFSKATLIEEVDLLREHFEGSKAELVFCHNDLNLPNILYEDPTASGVWLTLNKVLILLHRTLSLMVDFNFFSNHSSSTSVICSGQHWRDDGLLIIYIKAI